MSVRTDPPAGPEQRQRHFNPIIVIAAIGALGALLAGVAALIEAIK